MAQEKLKLDRPANLGVDPDAPPGFQRWLEQGGVKFNPSTGLPLGMPPGKKVTVIADQAPPAVISSEHGGIEGGLEPAEDPVAGILMKMANGSTVEGVETPEGDLESAGSAGAFLPDDGGQPAEDAMKEATERVHAVGEMFGGPTAAAIRLATDRGVNLQLVKGTGKDGRVTLADVERYLDEQLEKAAIAEQDEGIREALGDAPDPVDREP